MFVRRRWVAFMRFCVVDCRAVWSGGLCRAGNALGPCTMLCFFRGFLHSVELPGFCQVRMCQVEGVACMLWGWVFGTVVR